MDSRVPVAPSTNTRVAQIALDLPLNQSFDFLASDITHNDIGRLAVVPFGNRKLTGMIVAVANHSEVPSEKLKAVIHIQRALPALTANDFALLRFCENYYHHPFGPVALNAMPPALRVTKPIVIKPNRVVTITSLGRAALESLPAGAIAQRDVLMSLLVASLSESAIQKKYPRASSILSVLDSKQWITIRQAANGDTEIKSVSNSMAKQFVTGPDLNSQQHVAVSTVAASLGTFSPFLLSGITGSGKTEVYLHLIANALQHNRQALILVPEINLTPQFLRHIESRFPNSNVAQQHSALAAVARMRGYLDAQSGRADIVIGTRLSVFTPMPRLGIIIIDEEHDSSFKQQEGFRYSARDVAVFRAQLVTCPIVLGSATPSMESIHNVERDRFRMLTLTQRATPNAQLPTIDFIDLNSERAEDGLTQSLITAIRNTILRGEQTLLFINRRGFAPALVCTQCGWIPHCKRCSARLVLHQKERRLKCHHCGFQSRIATACHDCGNLELLPSGQGTERIEATLREKLPLARIARVDRDSTRKKGAAEKIFSAAAAGDLDVLVGTQMLAKGHDFPKITLVGVINADGAMFSADFRASERMVAQLMQVAGRAGRANLPGRVLIQTRFAMHPLYQAVAAQDHARYAKLAIAERKLAHLPPYRFLALLRAESKTSTALMAFMEEATAAAQRNLKTNGIHIWDPVPAPLSRKADYERVQLMVQSDSRSALQKFLATWLNDIRAKEMRGVNWVIDVDPLEV